jgi:hypothetical protein
LPVGTKLGTVQNKKGQANAPSSISFYGSIVAHGTELLTEDAMVWEALLDPLSQDPFAFSISNRDGRKISLGFYGQVPSPAPSARSLVAGDFQQSTRFFLSIVTIACTTCAW